MSTPLFHIFRRIFLLIIALFSFFLILAHLPASAAGTKAPPSSIDCGAFGLGEKFAIFRLTYVPNDLLKFDEEGNPYAEKLHYFHEVCIKVKEGQTSVSYQEFIKPAVVHSTGFSALEWKVGGVDIVTCGSSQSGISAQITLGKLKLSCPNPPWYNNSAYDGYIFHHQKDAENICLKSGSTGSCSDYSVDMAAFVRFWTPDDFCKPIKDSVECDKNAVCGWFAGSCHAKSEVDALKKVIDCSALLQNATCGPETCKTMCEKYSNCIYQNNACKNKETLTSEEKQLQLTDAINKSNEERYKAPTSSNFLPKCAYPGTCDSVNDLLVVFINIAGFLFKIIGTAAFVSFVYGGFMMVISLGNEEKVTKGKGIMVAAIIGIIVAFGAYTIVDLILDVFQVSNEYRAVGNLDLEKKKK